MCGTSFQELVGDSVVNTLYR